jgi:hypothetical protein
VCTISGCAAGWHDCNAKAADGCESNLSDELNCGQCGKVCTAKVGAPVCEQGACWDDRKLLIRHFFKSALSRTPTSSEMSTWYALHDFEKQIGSRPREGYLLLARNLLLSAEYAALATSDSAYAGHLFLTFFNDAAPASAELSGITGKLAAGASRNDVAVDLGYDARFGTFVDNVIGTTQVRAEFVMIHDQYRVFMSREPDAPGYAFWVGKFQAAQCAQSLPTLRTSLIDLNYGLIVSSEYAGFSRSDSRFVEDLYDAVLHRSPTQADKVYWTGALQTDARSLVMQNFVNAAEVDARLNQVIAAGCP